MVPVAMISNRGIFILQRMLCSGAFRIALLLKLVNILRVTYRDSFYSVAIFSVISCPFCIFPSEI